MILDLYCMDPRVWDPALGELGTLKAKQWILGILIDVWLLDMWRTRYHQTPFRFLPSQFVYVTQCQAEENKEPTAEQIRAFQHFFDDLPQSKDEGCEIEDSICVLNTGGDHYCTVIFMPSTRCIHVLGRRISVNRRSQGSKDWGDWGGPQIWTWVRKLYGWSQEQVQGMSVNSVDWKQNGFDCGPIACQVIESIWVRGLSLDREGLWKGPNLPCSHAQRLNMATKLHQLVTAGCRKFLEWKDIYREQITGYLGTDGFDGFVEEAEKVQETFLQNPGYALKPVDTNIRSAILTCPSCQRAVTTGISA